MLKIPKLRKHLASINIGNAFECVTVLDSTNFVTYAHKEHSAWKVGDEFNIWLYDDSSVLVRVSEISTKLDLVWLKTDTPLNITPASRHIPYKSQLYIQLGFSATEQTKTSFNVQLGNDLELSFWKNLST